MPNITVRAAAEGMPAINRRRLLNLAGAGLALAATVASVRKAPAATPTAGKEKVSAALRALIKDHKAKWAYWSSVCTCCDQVKLGREPTEAEHDTWHDANDGEHDALTAICRYPARTVADQVAKGRYLRKFNDGYMGDLQPVQFDALLLSMARARKAVQS